MTGLPEYTVVGIEISMFGAGKESKWLEIYVLVGNEWLCAGDEHAWYQETPSSKCPQTELMANKNYIILSRPI